MPDFSAITRRFKPIQRWFSVGKRLPTYLGIFSVMFCLWLQLAAPPAIDNLVQRLEYLVYDLRLSIMPKHVKSPENKVVIVDLDERSLQAEGQYPWNRILVGRLTEKLRDYGALVIGFDITFPEPDRSVRDMLAPVDLNSLDEGFSKTLDDIEPLINSDLYFANAMQTVDSVLAINFNPESDATYNELPPSIFDISDDLAEIITVRDMTGYTGNISILQEAAFGNGSMNQQPDADGIVRRVPLVIRFGTSLYPTLSLEMFRVYMFAEGYELLTENYNGLRVVRGIRIGRGAGAFEIPTDGLGQVLVPYVGPSSLGSDQNFPYISATDVLRDNLDAEEELALRNSLVLVGTSAPGLLDLRSTPLDQVYPGVEVHANMLNALLDSQTTVDVSSGDSDTQSVFANFQPANDVYFPYRPDWEVGAMFVVILALGLAMCLAFPHLGAASITASALTLIAAILWSNFQLWSVYKMDFPLVLLLFMVLLVTSVNMIYGFLAESQTRKVIKGMFDQYVPPAHIDQMLDDPDEYSFDGESKELTVLFSDIRSFTTISESLSATELKTMLNEFFTPITEIIFKHQGTIDKYIGDLVMAFWGAPLDDPDHRRNAVLAALDMLQKVEELKAEFKDKGFPECNVGVGVNSGIMNVGDMGSTYRRSYTVLGDAVNLGSRLEGLTKEYGVKLLIGEETAKGLDGFLLRLIDKVKVKGKNEAIECYEPLCELDKADEKQKASVADFHEALNCYHGQDWDGAEQRLKALLENEPGCILYEVYLGRIETLRLEELPEDWDGSYTFTHK